ncbi:hypothetical protein KC332_g5661 [Hortaea werneckii]|nr:hypothetical protein KC358_g5508 [Hortaea werneckii]KAI6853215.1 hypothetical protein KC350_g153 [Hortaea werneckii]KAI6934314.1 hypothetical protein KC348_g6539 [Hortaea werneckii]KAI6945305.1 hypothetical protein KC341_g199 [Hortaea werneckii]KAI6973404.1 hypothetical protein KC321_g5693 [Hortaea werneckii]
MELTDILPSLIRILAMGIAIGLSIVAVVLFILSLWRLGCILGQPAFMAILNSSPFRDTYTDDKDEKDSSGTHDTPPTKQQQQQRPRLPARERKAKDARILAGTVALFLCYVGASIELSLETPHTWKIPVGQDAAWKYAVLFVCLIILKGCLEGPTPKNSATESMDSFVTSLTRSLTSGLLAGFSIGAIGGFLILVWRVGSYVGRPLGLAVAKACITEPTGNENEGDPGPKASNSTSTQQQQPAESSLEEKRLRVAGGIGGIATAYLCIGFLFWEIAVAPSGTWDLAPGESAEKFLIPGCVIALKACFEAIVAVGVLSGSVRVLGL